MRPMVISATSGRRMPAGIVSRSRLRKWVGLAWVEVEYLRRGLKGVCLGRAWMRPGDMRYCGIKNMEGWFL